MSIGISTPNAPLSNPDDPGLGAISIGQSSGLAAALSLLDDQSVDIRRRAARYICDHAKEVKSLPNTLIECALSDEDEEVVCSVVRAVPTMSCATYRFVPALMYLLADSSFSVRVEAASVLGALGEDGAPAHIPMQFFSRTDNTSSRDPRVIAFEKALSGVYREEYNEVGRRVDEVLSAGLRGLYSLLHDMYQAHDVRTFNVALDAILLGMCVGSERIRSGAYRVCQRHGSTVSSAFPGMVEGALALIARDEERFRSRATKVRFFEACCETKQYSGLELVLPLFSVRNDTQLELHRDYTAVFLSGRKPYDPPLERMYGALWAADPDTVSDAAGDLGVVAERLSHPEKIKILERIFGALIDRAGESRKITRALVYGIRLLSGLDRELVTMCSSVLSKSMGPDVEIAIATVLRAFPFENVEQKQRAELILKYLRSSEYRRVAAAAQEDQAPWRT